MANVIDIVLKVLGSGESNAAINRTSGELQDLGEQGKRTADNLDEIGAGSSNLNKLESASRSAGASLEYAKSKSESLRGSLEGIRNFGAGMAVVGAGGVLVSRSLAQMGNDVVESENLVKESFGAQLEAAQEWSDGLNRTLGLNAVDVRRSAGVFNVMFNSMGLASGEAFNMSKSLTELAYDMASFYNLSPEEAFEKLRAGITGEAEPLKALGVLLTEETVKQKAYAAGIAATGSQLTEQQKVQARYALIVQQTSKAHGDLARTMDSGANIARVTGDKIKLAQQAIGVGSSTAEKHINAVTSALAGVVANNPGLAAGAGYLLSYGSYATAAIGSLLAMGGQLGQTYLGLVAYRNAKLAAAAATNIFATAEWNATFAAIDGAAAQTTNAVATTAAGNASAGAAVKVGVLAAVQASAATSVSAASLGMIGAWTLVGVAVGAATFGILFKLGQMVGLIDRNRSAMEDLRRGWSRLTEGTEEAEAKIGDAMYENEGKLIKRMAAKMRSDGRSESEIDAYVLRAEREREEKWTEEFGRHGYQDRATSHSEKLGQLRKQEEAARAAAVPITMPTVPSPGSPALAIAPTTAPAATPAGKDQFPVITPESIMQATAMSRLGGMGLMAPAVTGAATGTPMQTPAGETVVVKAKHKTVRDTLGGIRVVFDDIIIPRGGIDGALGAV